MYFVTKRQELIRVGSKHEEHEGISEEDIQDLLDFNEWLKDQIASVKQETVRVFLN